MKNRQDRTHQRSERQSPRSYRQDDGYGSTQGSRDFRNQSEDRYQSAMDFGSHNYDPQPHHGQSYISGYNDPRYSSESRMDRTSSFGEQTYGSQGAGFGTTSGQHSGKGPKGYKRSDDRIKEEVSDLIMRHDEIDGTDIEVEVNAGEVTLTGTVPDRSLKHLVENLIDRTLGVGEIHNHLRVKRGDSMEETDRNAEKSVGGKKPTTTNPRH